MTKIKIPMFINLGAAILFTLLSLSFSGDISLLAFPLAAVLTFFTVFFLFVKAYRKSEYKSARISRKFLQYIPFVFLASFIIRRAGNYGTPYWYDVITVILWCIVFVSSLIILFYLNEKRIFKLVPEWKEFSTSKNKKGGIISTKAERFTIKSILLEIVDWIDALVQAVFMVLLIQIFIFQLYVIPSESMVPAFLIGDRVVVFKTLSGPKFPLSDVGLPDFRGFNRGDIVVFRNPHYSMDRKSEVKSVISQIVYMLTFTGVNLNVDENGEPKADPLVKRICGEPGEQLVMQDGILYKRTKENPQWQAVDLDQKFACWNLNSLDSQLKSKVETIPLTQNQYDIMLQVEQKRQELNVDSAAEECKKLAEEYKNLNVQLDSMSDYFNMGNYLIKSSENFSSFMTDWISQKAAALEALKDDVYAMANYKLNLMIKLNLGKNIVRYCQLIKNHQEQLISSDNELRTLGDEERMLYFYVQILDQRNMPVFPANSKNGEPTFIPEDSYFMMGDNRFNSLDMRHSYESKLVFLTAWDPHSVPYLSNMSPQFVNKKYILGTTSFRFFPLNRLGTIATR